MDHAPHDPRPVPAAPPARLNWALPCLLSLLPLPACGGDATTLIVVSLSGVTAGASQISVDSRLDHLESKYLEVFPSDTSRFGLRLQAGMTGSLWIDVMAEDEAECTLAEGQTTVRIAAPGGEIPVSIELMAVPPDCPSPQSRKVEH